MARIEPTVGRVVHIVRREGIPLFIQAGIITEVHCPPPPGFDVEDARDFIQIRNQNTLELQTLLLVQEDDSVGEVPYAVWMPFQKGQAGKTEQLEKALKEAGPGPMVEITDVTKLPGDLIGTPPAFRGTLAEAVSGLKGPHISPEMVNYNIASTTFHVTPSGRTTICELTLRNGFTVRGESTVMRMENFKEKVGREISYQDAWNKIWALMAYALAQGLYEGTAKTPGAAV